MPSGPARCWPPSSPLSPISRRRPPSPPMVTAAILDKSLWWVVGIVTTVMMTMFGAYIQHANKVHDSLEGRINRIEDTLATVKARQETLIQYSDQILRK